MRFRGSICRAGSRRGARLGTARSGWNLWHHSLSLRGAKRRSNRGPPHGAPSAGIPPACAGGTLTGSARLDRHGGKRRLAMTAAPGALLGAAVAGRAAAQIAVRKGLTIFTPAKSFSLSVATTQSFASATAAMIMSSALRGRPIAVASAISRAQMSAAVSSNARTRPANSACGPSGPANQRSNSRRFFRLVSPADHARSRRGSVTR